MSTAISLWPIIKGLILGAKLLVPDSADYSETIRQKCSYWKSVNQEQQAFLEEYYLHKKKLNFFNDNELKVWASTNHDYLNTILKNENLPEQFKPLGANAVGIFSNLDIEIKWLYKGCKSSIEDFSHEKWESDRQIIKREFSAIALRDGFKRFSSDYDRRIFITRIQTANNQTVWIAEAHTPLKGRDELLHYIGKIRSSLSPYHPIAGCRCGEGTKITGPDVLRIPMINLDIVEDISWMQGMQYWKPGERIKEDLIFMTLWKQVRPECKGSVGQITQRIKFKMTEEGEYEARAQASDENGYYRILSIGSIHPPFYLWVEREGLSMPVFAACISADVLKEVENQDA